MNYFRVSFVVLLCIGLIIGSYVILFLFPDTVTGKITDKFITNTAGGYPIYYFIINESSEVRVDIETYYNFEIGDYYNGTI